MDEHLVWGRSEECDLTVYYIAGRTTHGAPSNVSRGIRRDATQPYLAIGPDEWIMSSGCWLCLNLRQASHGNWGSIERIAVNQAGIRQVSIAPARGGALQAVWSARNAAGVWDLVYSQRVADETPTPTVTSTATVTPQGTVPPLPTRTSTPTLPPLPPTATATSRLAARRLHAVPSITPSHTAIQYLQPPPQRVYTDALHPTLS
jgi:hypothetical protein